MEPSYMKSVIIARPSTRDELSFALPRIGKGYLLVNGLSES